MTQEELLIPSTLDGSLQPSLFYRATQREKRSLLVALHTWSHDRFNQVQRMVPVAQKHDFHLLLPEFRGNNLKTNPNRTQACGSEYAKQDIQDAIDYVVAHENVDTGNIFLLGLSGGGHMSLLMAGKCPEYFRAIGAYVPITDLEVWAQQNASYRDHIIACCSGNTEEMRKRSPMSYIDTIAKANIKIFHGKFDPVVPVSHSIRFFNAMMERYPRSTVYLDVFDGGHQIDMETAMYWLLSQYRSSDQPQQDKKTEITG